MAAADILYEAKTCSSAFYEGDLQQRSSPIIAIATDRYCDFIDYAFCVYLCLGNFDVNWGNFETLLEKCTSKNLETLHHCKTDVRMTRLNARQCDTDQTIRSILSKPEVFATHFHLFCGTRFGKVCRRLYPFGHAI